MSQIREEFVGFARQEGANVSALCRQFGISRPCGYKWLARSEEGDYEDRSRRPHKSPRHSSEEVEARVLALRKEHPFWGGRKLRRLLQNDGMEHPPSASTITEILRRQDLLGERAGELRDWQRFEKKTPNELWQMDFKGHFQMLNGRCHPLTVVDDCARFSPLLLACRCETGSVVQEGLTGAFRRYGVPLEILFDNGGPWGGFGEITALGAWLMRVGVRIHHGQPYHPQTQGKIERFHKSLKLEVLGKPFRDLGHCQEAFDHWRHTYNQRRPHDSLELDTPASRYRPSPRIFPETLPPLEYDAHDEVRKVQSTGRISFLGREIRVGKGLSGMPVGVRPSTEDGVYEVRLATQIVAQVNLRHNPKGSEV